MSSIFVFKFKLKKKEKLITIIFIEISDLKYKQVGGTMYVYACIFRNLQNFKFYNSITTTKKMPKQATLATKKEMLANFKP